MKVITSKNNQSTNNKFEKSILSDTKKKSIKGGNDPIIIEDYVNI